MLPTSEPQTLAPQLDPPKMAELLRRKVAGEPFPYSFIHMVDPYSAAPEDLVQGRKHAPSTDPDDGVAWYFCWHAKYHGSAGGRSVLKRKRKVAAAGATYWHPEMGKQAIIDQDKKHVGAYKCPLSYMSKTRNPPTGGPAPFTKKRLGWCMLEIGLDDDDDDQKLVLCKLYKPPRPPTHRETSRKSSMPGAGGNMPCPEPDAVPSWLGSEISSRVAIVKNGSSSAAAAAMVTVVIDLCGSSIPPAQHMKHMVNLVRELKSPVVLLSAMGNTTTQILLAAWKALSCGVEKVCEINELVFIKELHIRTTDELGLETSTVLGSFDDLERQLQHIAMTQQLTSRMREYLVFFGESTSTKIFYEYLNKLEGTLQEWKLCVVATSGRGSSDLTGTTINRALESREIQVWKDVDGMFSCDPKVCADAALVPHLTFDEAAELRDFNEQTMRLAIEYGMTVRVRNMYNPQAPGTVITKTRDMSESILISIVSKSNITMLDIKSKRVLGQTDFVSTACSKFKHFEYLGISVEIEVNTEGKMSFTLAPSELLSQELLKLELDNVVEELQKIADVHRLQNVSLVSLIGNAQKSVSIEEKAFSVVRSINAEVHRHKFSRESSKVMKAFLVVDDNRAKDCVQALHLEFFKKSLVSQVVGVEKSSSVIVNSLYVADSSSSSVKKRKPEVPPCGRGLESPEKYYSVLESIEQKLLWDDDPIPFGGDVVWDPDEFLANNVVVDDGDLMPAPVGTDDNARVLVYKTVPGSYGMLDTSAPPYGSLRLYSPQPMWNRNNVSNKQCSCCRRLKEGIQRLFGAIRLLPAGCWSRSRKRDASVRK